MSQVEPHELVNKNKILGILANDNGTPVRWGRHKAFEETYEGTLLGFKWEQNFRRGGGFDGLLEYKGHIDWMGNIMNMMKNDYFATFASKIGTKSKSRRKAFEMPKTITITRSKDLEIWTSVNGQPADWIPYGEYFPNIVRLLDRANTNFSKKAVKKDHSYTEQWILSKQGKLSDDELVNIGIAYETASIKLRNSQDSSTTSSSASNTSKSSSSSSHISTSTSASSSSRGPTSLLLPSKLHPMTFTLPKTLPKTLSNGTPQEKRKWALAATAAALAATSEGNKRHRGPVSMSPPRSLEEIVNMQFMTSPHVIQPPPSSQELLQQEISSLLSEYAKSNQPATSTLSQPSSFPEQLSAQPSPFLEQLSAQPSSFPEQLSAQPSFLQPSSFLQQLSAQPSPFRSQSSELHQQMQPSELHQQMQSSELHQQMRQSELHQQIPFEPSSFFSSQGSAPDLSNTMNEQQPLLFGSSQSLYQKNVDFESTQIPMRSQTPPTVSTTLLLPAALERSHTFPHTTSSDKSFDLLGPDNCETWHFGEELQFV
jgi:hypothetical protein